MSITAVSGVSTSSVGSSGGNLVTGVKDSAGVRLVLATAAYTGHKLSWSQGDTFSATVNSLTLTDPVAVATYLASTAASPAGNVSVQLSSGSASDQAGVLQWLLYGLTDLRHSVLGWTAPTTPGHQLTGCNPGTLASSKAASLGGLHALNTHLSTRTYLVGERLSLADIGLAITLIPAFTQVSDFYDKMPLFVLTYSYHGRF